MTERLATPGGDVSVAWDGPLDASVALVLGPGAGADMNHEFMVYVANALAESGLRVCRFNFLYAERGRRSPDRAQVLEETLAAAIEAARAGNPKARLFAGGKSMGGRIASQVVASGTAVDGLVFLGYPLHPPGRPENQRAAHLKEIRVPMLFVEGTRDPFCPLDTLEKVRADLGAETTVAVIDDGDHSFKVRKSSGRTTKEAWNEVAGAVVEWVKQH
jgi:predicted alpha/beta-hydrolase family hydrolase